jgi:hypothetical protein
MIIDRIDPANTPLSKLHKIMAIMHISFLQFSAQLAYPVDQNVPQYRIRNAGKC